jgi:hypothetical protein
MPLKHVRPDVVIEHNGVQVFETYINRNFDTPNFFVYSTSADELDQSSQFDIRTLPGLAGYDMTVPEDRISALYAAIDLGVIGPNRMGPITIH